jgi:hypothetical protein
MASWFAGFCSCKFLASVIQRQKRSAINLATIEQDFKSHRVSMQQCRKNVSIFTKHVSEKLST